MKNWLRNLIFIVLSLAFMGGSIALGRFAFPRLFPVKQEVIIPFDFPDEPGENPDGVEPGIQNLDGQNPDKQNPGEDGSNTKNTGENNPDENGQVEKSASETPKTTEEILRDLSANFIFQNKPCEEWNCDELLEWVKSKCVSYEEWNDEDDGFYETDYDFDGRYGIDYVYHYVLQSKSQTINIVYGDDETFMTAAVSFTFEKGSNDISSITITGGKDGIEGPIARDCMLPLDTLENFIAAIDDGMYGALLASYKESDEAQGVCEYEYGSDKKKIFVVSSFEDDALSSVSFYPDNPGLWWGSVFVSADEDGRINAINIDPSYKVFLTE